jgi:hypothetical protein
MTGKEHGSPPVTVVCEQIEDLPVGRPVNVPDKTAIPYIPVGRVLTRQSKPNESQLRTPIRDACFCPSGKNAFCRKITGEGAARTFFALHAQRGTVTL